MGVSESMMICGMWSALPFIAVAVPRAGAAHAEIVLGLRIPSASGRRSAVSDRPQRPVTPVIRRQGTSQMRNWLTIFTPSSSIRISATPQMIHTSHTKSSRAGKLVNPARPDLMRSRIVSTMITATMTPTPIRPRCEEMMIGGLMALQKGVG